MTTGVDVWALGVILYQLLTNRLPFRAETREATWRRILQDEPQRPGSINRRVDRDLETICLKCLDKDHQRRGSAEVLAHQLDLWLEGRPIDIRPYSAWEKAVKWSKRKPAIAALSAIIALVAVLGLAGILWQWRNATAARRTAERNEAKAKQSEVETKSALSVSDFIQAVRLIGENNSHVALAYLARSLRGNPTNDAALTRLTTLLTYHSWPLPVTGPMRHSAGVYSDSIQPRWAADCNASVGWRLTGVGCADGPTAGRADEAPRRSELKAIQSGWETDRDRFVGYDGAGVGYAETKASHFPSR